MKVYRILLLLIFCSFSIVGFSQEENNSGKDYDLEDIMTKDELENRKERVIYRRLIWERVHDDLEKHFRVPDLGWYVNIGTGYGIPFIREPLKSPLDFVGDSDLTMFGNKVEEKAIIGTNGGGFLASFAFGKMIRPHFGFELEVSMDITPDILNARKRTETLTSEQYNQSYLVGFSPGLVFNTDNINNVYFYGKLGMYIPFGGTTVTNARIKDSELATVEYFFPFDPIAKIVDAVHDILVDNELAEVQVAIDAKAKSTYVPTLGLNASLGLRYQISKTLSFFGEFEVIAFSIQPKETEFVEFQMDVTATLLGQEIIRESIDETEAPEYVLVTNYKKKLDGESNNMYFNEKGRFGIDTQEPNEQLAFRQSGSGFFGKVGVQIDFGYPRIEKGKKTPKLYIPGFENVAATPQTAIEEIKQEAEEKKAEKKAKKAEKKENRKNDK